MQKPNLNNEEPIALKLSKLPEDFTTDALYRRLNKEQKLDYFTFDQSIRALNPHLDSTQARFLKSSAAVGLVNYLRYDNDTRDKDPEIFFPAAAANDPVIAELLKRREESQPSLTATLTAAVAAVVNSIIPAAQAGNDRSDKAVFREQVSRDQAAAFAAEHVPLIKREDELASLALQAKEPVSLPAASQFAGDSKLDSLLASLSSSQPILGRSRHPVKEAALLQAALVELGYLPMQKNGKSTIDSYFGKDTETAVRALQTDMHKNDPDFDIDGVVGKQTWKALAQRLEQKRSAQPVNADIGNLSPPKYKAAALIDKNPPSIA